MCFLSLFFWRMWFMVSLDFKDLWPQSIENHWAPWRSSDSSKWLLRSRLSMGGLCLLSLPASYVLPAPHSSLTTYNLLNSLLIYTSVPLNMLFLLPKCSPLRMSSMWKIDVCPSRNDQRIFCSVKPSLISLGRASYPLSLFFQTIVLSLYFIMALVLLADSWVKVREILGTKQWESEWKERE